MTSLLIDIDRTAHRMNNELKRSYVSAVHDEPKALAVPSIFSEVKRRREEGDPLMLGGNYRHHEQLYQEFVKDGKLYRQKKQ